MSSMYKIQLSLHQWALLFSAMAIALIVLTGNVRYTRGDSRYSLLVSQAILEHGSIHLDPYHNDLDLSRHNNGKGWMLSYWDSNQHTYYFYPIGTSLLSVPFVLLANTFGMDMVYYDQESQLQLMISAFVLALIFLLLYRMARLFLDPVVAHAFALGMVLCTSLISTHGVALWSQTYETFLILSVLYIFARAKFQDGYEVKGWQVGVLLFLAYLCRPTASVFVALSIGYVFWQHRSALPKVLLYAGGLFLLFVLWSFLEFHSFLPRYYDPATWKQKGPASFVQDFLAMVFSPARGLLIFTPVLVLGLGGLAMRSVRFHPLYLFVTAWFLLHTVVIARSPMPWGGWSYGPRFYAEMIPGFALVLLLVARNLQEIPAQVRVWMPRAFLVLSIFGLYVHTVKGIYDNNTFFWNGTPPIDEFWKDYRWNWRYPQFMASEEVNSRKNREHQTRYDMELYTNRLPEKASVLIGNADAELRSFFMYWNSEGMVKGKKLYNSLAALERDEAMEFWFPREKLNYVSGLPVWRIDSSSAQLTTEAFFRANAQDLLVLSIKDEGSNQLGPKARKYLRDRGSKIDSLKLRDSYIAVLDSGKLIHEELGPRALEYKLPKKGNYPEIVVRSAGHDVGDFSSIKVYDKEYSLNARGLNIVVFGDYNDVLWSTNFDTHKEDIERRAFYRAVRKRPY
jgi:hypothetical protein